ncbi:AraC family transcriptional regulator [Meridianimarinicoccus roseus]|jgi:transcriptional regulator GlxA family with amidase domain|uniref:AraC family transcriptional regulator n=1 Tax=Meridianimarinicoccus roseus TaxID=2072018 RepID=A0A2V2LIJ7_9RHOB|nr:GlxA family transcriptional regulator [Meridianimarinicoccus roseus]PWR02996.1 AraC family transcriptional regulator [Meridianimarinicoccus roseus]
MKPVSAPQEKAPPLDKPHRFVFVLLPRFSLLAFSAAVEALRVANRMSGRTCYSWSYIGDGGTTATSSAGTTITLDSDLVELGRDDTVIVCGGIDVQDATTRRLLNWLRREARRGCPVGGLCTGAHVLAEAGLLDGRRATIHWENQDSFSEEFEDVLLTKSVFTIDGGRYTTAGGTASIDLMLKLIAKQVGEDVASAVADQLIYSSIRTDQDVQRLSIPTRIGVRHPKLATVIKQMEANIEEPISPAVLAREVGLSTRQLERLFRRYLSRSPKRYYMELRLSKARNLLMQTDMSVINVALACGFTSPSHFSKCYRAQYNTTPYRERGAMAADRQSR